MNHYPEATSDQMLDEMTLIGLSQVIEIVLKDYDNSTSFALKAVDRLAARMESQLLQRSCQDLMSWPARFCS